MFRIRRIADDALPIDKRQIEQVQSIWRSQFPEVREEEVAGLAERLRNPVKFKFRALLFVADNLRGDVRGFALVLHDADLRFCFLDYIASDRKLTGGGVGGALYQRLRDDARGLGAVGLFFECHPDDPTQCVSADAYRSNVARLRFYERYGARPVIRTAFETPIRDEQYGMPFLMFDGLGRATPLRRDAARKIVRAILSRKYAHLCPPAYIEMVVGSFRDDPVELRPLRYVRAEKVAAPPRIGGSRECIVLVVNDRHDIHHVRERGYVEAPVRIRSILKEIEPTGLFRRVAPKEFAESRIRAVHDGPFIDYLKRVCQSVAPGKSVYPYVFPIRNETRPPKDLAIRAGYYCIDTFTPLNHNAYLAAKRAVDCALTASEAILRGDRLAYALVRPPGHHAEHRAFGGFCYFNNGAVAAHYLSAHGRVAILDIDYHHGNGQQMIFYERSDVLTVSIHGHPRFAYPYFSGFEDERGAGAGEGFNINYPMPESVDGKRYRETLERALNRIRRFAPRFLVVALGLDPAKGDPTGTWSLVGKDFEQNGRLIGELRLPTLVVQEGGYRTRTLGINARSFFTGMASAMFGAPPNNGKRMSRRSFIKPSLEVEP